MTEKVLTDAEMREIHRNVKWHREIVWDFARAVEAAVLKKVRCVHDCRICGSSGVVRCGNSSCSNSVPPAPMGYVTEREARKRERAAYVHGWQDGQGDAVRTYPKERLDSCYPLPKTTRPRTVTLSDWTKVRRDGDGWVSQKDGDYIAIKNGTPFWLAKIPADARLLADLVDNPTEEVEE